MQQDGPPDLAACACARGRGQSGAGGRAAKFQRGQAVATRAIPDKKLKARMRYSERLASEAAHLAAKTDEWLLPSEPGALEVEGMERTWQIQQARRPAQQPGFRRSVLPSVALGKALSCNCRWCWENSRRGALHRSLGWDSLRS